jgi:hypothetical protein
LPVRAVWATAVSEPINPVRDAIEANYRNRPCACCRAVNRGVGPDLDQASCPCEWWMDPYGMNWCGACQRCYRIHCRCPGRWAL